MKSILFRDEADGLTPFKLYDPLASIFNSPETGTSRKLPTPHAATEAPELSGVTMGWANTAKLAAGIVLLGSSMVCEIGSEELQSASWLDATAPLPGQIFSVQSYQSQPDLVEEGGVPSERAATSDEGLDWDTWNHEAYLQARAFCGTDDADPFASES